MIGRDFVYCGNRLPASIDIQTVEEIRFLSEVIASELNLVGSIGIDFVVSPIEEIWVMEVNPRFQGSLEMLEYAADISMSELHVRACHGDLPDDIPSFKPTTKMVVYANRDGIVPDLKQWPSTVDRSPAGVEVHKGDPICSIIETGIDGSQVFSKVQSISAEILENI